MPENAQQPESFIGEAPVPLSQYMEQALRTYYGSRDVFGKDGDFTTSPEISQLFGEMIGIWCVHCWEQLGKPDAVAVVELGPGRGTLMRDALRAMKVAPDFMHAVEIHLVENSPVLRDIQRETLDDYLPVWHDTLCLLPQDVPLIIIANEFFDALPIEQLIYSQGTWRRRMVEQDKDKLQFSFGETQENIPDLPVDNVKEGDIYEYSPARRDWMEQLCLHIREQKGAMLTIDYGYASEERGDTLQAIRQHQYVDPLETPGQADITSHVNFADLEDIAQTQGLNTFPLLNQRQFLMQMGVMERLAKLAAGATLEEQQQLQAGYQRLTDAAGMGSLFRAFGVSSKKLKKLAGFV